MYWRYSLSLVFILVVSVSLAQHQELNEKPEIYKGVKIKDSDPRSLQHAFKNGSINGHFRYFFMATENEKELTDYHAHAAGGGIRFESAPFHGFQVAVSGFYIFNLGSSGLNTKDSTTGQSNRYEIALFDVQHPFDKNDIDRLEEFHIKYNHKKNSVTFGRQLINTPFINLQDGRMRPTGVNGIWWQYQASKKIMAEAGYLYAISPRGTTRWFGIGESMGIFSTGVNVDGSSSGYAQQINSSWVALTHMKYKSNERFSASLWNIYTDRVFNAVFVELTGKKMMSKNNSLIIGLQGIRQDAISDGGNPNPSKTYIPKNGKSMVFSGKIGWKHPASELSLNYTRITRHGRYLMPREWGRDPMYTFMARERNEGLGNVHAFVVRWENSFPGSSFSTTLSGGYYSLPSINDYRLNKYGMPSYFQMNLDTRYRFNGLLQGLEAQMLLVGKKNEAGEIPAKNLINKVNMLHVSFLLNYHF